MRYRVLRTILCEGGGGTLRRAVPAQIAATANIASPLPTTLFTAAVEWRYSVVVLLFDEKVRRYHTTTRAVIIGLFWQISPKKNYYYYSSYCAVPTCAAKLLFLLPTLFFMRYLLT